MRRFSSTEQLCPPSEFNYLTANSLPILPASYKWIFSLSYYGVFVLLANIVILAIGKSWLVVWHCIIKNVVQVLCTEKLVHTSSENVTITVVGSYSVPLKSVGEGWGILKEQEPAGVHKNPMDLQRVPEDRHTGAQTRGLQTAHWRAAHGVPVL